MILNLGHSRKEKYMKMYEMKYTVYTKQKDEIEKTNRDHMVNGLVNHAKDFAFYS